VNYSVGTNPNGLRAGDLNGDGKLDLVTANYASNNTSVLLGNGDGSFQHHVDYGSGTGPAQVTIGDFNSDGMLDLSVANQTANAMSVFLQTPVITQGCLPPPVGLVSWWSGDRTADDVQGANNGALLNGASFAKGMVGPGFRLDGIDDWVTIPNSSSLHPTQLTLDAWIYLTGNENLPRHVIGKDAVSSEREYSLGVNYANKVEGFVVVPSGLKVVTGVTDVSLNSWYHIAMTYDGAQARLYVDGVQEAVTDATGNIVPTKSPVGIGGDPFGEFTNGIVDEAQIFSRALSSSEIQSMYEAGAAGQCKPEIFVFSINPSYIVAHSQYLVTTSVAIQDTSGIAISGATANVKVRFPSGSEPIFPAQTDESGNATFSFYTSETGFYKFKVIRVSHPVRDYDPSLNVETSDTLVIP
jgi:hypothetical protein